MFYEWRGRIDNNTNGKRFHQAVQNIHIDEAKTSRKQDIGIVGFECDEGVKRNKGRVGASKAPNEIRKAMASIPCHYEMKKVIDVGNVACTDGDLEGAQKRLGKHVAALLTKNYMPIILGGGHETFYGHFLGVREAVGKEKKIGMINLDAHFDLRIDKTPSSGTMFRQILESDEYADYLCVGIQELGNTKQLFETAKEYDVSYILENDLYPLEEAFAKMDAFIEKQDYIIYTICTDAINQAYAPGVSAPTPFGLDPFIVRAVTKHVVLQQKFLSFDVSEVNPTVDVAGQTARLMGYVVAEIMMHLNKK